MAEHLLGASIAAYRKKAGMTQEDLGRALFVSGQAVSRWERGGTPDSDMLPKIADVLGISLDTLFGRSQTPQTQLETLLTQELKLTPDGRRIQRATQLAWHMMKVIAASSGEPGNSFFRAMTANEVNMFKVPALFIPKLIVDYLIVVGLNAVASFIKI